MSAENEAFPERVECPECGRTISKKSESFVDDTGCLFCRDGEES